jgi:hypothetical protein
MGGAPAPAAGTAAAGGAGGRKRCLSRAYSCVAIAPATSESRSRPMRAVIFLPAFVLPRSCTCLLAVNCCPLLCPPFLSSATMLKSVPLSSLNTVLGWAASVGGPNTLKSTGHGGAAVFSFSRSTANTACTTLASTMIVDLPVSMDLSPGSTLYVPTHGLLSG